MKSRLAVVAIALLAAPTSGASAQPVERNERAALVERIATELDRGYVFPDIGTAMARRVRERLGAGAYDAISEPAALAEALTSDLRAVSRDGHLRVITRAAAPRPASPEGQRRPPRPAVEGVERLAGNIGYVKVNGFPPASTIGPRLDSAMTTLAGTDAIIVDLRDNGGGAPDGAMYLAGFFLPRVTLVARIYSRQDDSMTEMFTGDVNAPRYLGKRVYLLTSRRTFSAGEAAAYHLKHVAHAITVGDTTGGGAHRIRTVDLDDRFAITLPFTRPINVVTNGDWEGTGVIPEIAAAPERALATAHRAALESLPRTAERAAAIRGLEGK